MPARPETKILINQTANYTFITLKRTLVSRLDTYMEYYSPKSQPSWNSVTRTLAGSVRCYQQRTQCNMHKTDVTSFLTAMSQMTFPHNSDGRRSNKTTSVRKTVTNINTLHAKILIWYLLLCFISPIIIFHVFVDGFLISVRD